MILRYTMHCSPEALRRTIILILIYTMSFAQHLFRPGIASFRSRVPPVRLASLSFAGTKNLLCSMPCFRIELV